MTYFEIETREHDNTVTIGLFLENIHVVKVNSNRIEVTVGASRAYYELTDSSMEELRKKLKGI